MGWPARPLAGSFANPLFDGVQIDPKEWWDSHWIKDHIAKRVDLPGFNN